MSAIKRRLAVFLLVMLLILGIMFTTVTQAHIKRKECIVLGAKDTVGQILSEVMAQLFEDRTNLQIERKFSLDGTFICFSAMLAGEIDMYVEYTGTALTSLLHKDWTEIPQGGVYEYLQKEFQKKFNFVWMKPFGFESSYVIIVDPEFSEKNGLKTLSDLERLVQEKPVRLALDPEFYARPEEKVLEEEYQIQVPHLKLLEHSLLYLALLNRSVDVINGYATDGFIYDHKLVVLEDDKKGFPPYEAAAIVRENVLQKYPEIQTVFDEISGKITLSKIQEMNYKVEKKGESVHDVAQYFLKREGYLSSH